MNLSKKYFFGWGNWKKLFQEVAKLYSNKNSFFSKKRIESGAAFIIAQWGMIYFLIKKIDVLTMSEMMMWSGIQFLVAGYTVTQIQSEKKAKSVEEEPTEEPINS
jgi:hypothetical protein